MAERLHVGTRKGLFELARRDGVWDIVETHFLGEPVSAVLVESRVCRIDSWVVMVKSTWPGLVTWWVCISRSYSG